LPRLGAVFRLHGHCHRRRLCQCVSRVSLVPHLGRTVHAHPEKPVNGSVAEHFIHPRLLSWFSFLPFSDLGAAYGTAKSGVGLSSMGVMKVCRVFRLFRIQVFSSPSSPHSIHFLIPDSLSLIPIQPELVMRNIIPVVMAGVLGIYGLIVAVVLIQAGTTQSVPSFIRYLSDARACIL
jgi:hypothetical protein